MPKVSSSLGRRVTVGAQQHADLVLGLLQDGLIRRLESVRDTGARAVDLEIGFGRDHQEVIARVAEHRALRFGHADHLERAAFHHDGFADRIRVGEELVFDVVADHGDFSARCLSSNR